MQQCALPSHVSGERTLAGDRIYMECLVNQERPCYRAARRRRGENGEAERYRGAKGRRERGRYLTVDKRLVRYAVTVNNVWRAKTLVARAKSGKSENGAVERSDEPAQDIRKNRNLVFVARKIA